MNEIIYKDITLLERKPAIEGNEKLPVSENEYITPEQIVDGLAQVAKTGSYEDLNNKPTIPGRLSDLADDSRHRTVTDDEKASWSSKSTFNGDYNNLTNKPDLSQFITKSVDDLTNYYLKSETYTKAEVLGLIEAIQQFHYEVYASLSDVTSPAGNVLYLIGPTGSGADKYDEYVYDSTKNPSWIKIGDTSVDLSGYVTTTALNTALANYTTTANLTTLLAGKQDVVSDLATIRSGAAAGATAYQKPSGGIPSSDLSSAVQTSLGKADSAYQKPGTGIPAEDIASGVIPTALSELSDDTTHRVVTDTEKTTWSGKQDAIADLATIRSGAAAGAEAAYREYDSQTPNGLGYKVLDKDATFAEQVTDANTIYEIRYDYDLNNGSVTIPAGCVLKFNGGTISNGTLTGDFHADAWGFDDVTIEGYVDFVNALNVPTDNPKEFIETILGYKAASSVEPTVFNFGAGKVYNWTGVLTLDKKNITLTGGGTIEGTIHLGMTKQDAIDAGFGTNWTTWHFDYIIQGLRFSKYAVIGYTTNSSAILDYIKAASADNDDNVAISLVNVAHVKIADCFFDNVPYPVVYRPNSTYVNQNVRRLNITNCDFERCHTGILAPSIVESATEYGDMLVANCNFYPTHAGIDCECIDGLKIFNNIFNTGMADTHPFNVKAYMPGQVVITGNSFYGEYNDYAVMLDSPGNALITGNLFSNQGTAEGNYPSSVDMIAALVLKRTNNALPCLSLTITGNQFLNVNKPAMICNAVSSRTCSISGNTMTQNADIDSYRLLWIDPTRATVNFEEVQQMTGPSIPSGYWGNLAFRSAVIKDILAGANYGAYQADAPKWNQGRLYLYNTVNVRVKNFTKTRPVTVVRYAASRLGSEATQVPFIFNGVKYSVTLSSATSAADAFAAIISAITADWGNDYDFQAIAGLLWIVGKTSSAPCNSLFYELSDTPGNNAAALYAVYQNLGYRIEITAADGKGRIGTSSSYLNSNYYGICGSDNGKLLNFAGKTVTLKASNVSGKKGELYFRTLTTPTSGYSFVLLDNDTFFGFETGTTGTASSIVSAIVTLAYSHLYTVSGNYLKLIEEGVEFYYLQTQTYNWYWTWNGHVASYSFVTDDGRTYDPVNDRFNDSGTTTQRPSASSVRAGFVYFDKTLGKCIVSTGSAWVNMDGTAL